MRFGVVILPEARWAEARSRWQRAEGLGFGTAWTYDHLTWRSFRDTAWFGAVPTLAAAAAATSTIRLGTLVASPNFRHPVPFAKELLTLDDLSGGRVTLGVGSGGTGWDATMLGQEPLSPVERADRFAEFVELTDLLLRQPAASWRGRYYAADEARTHPGCVQRPRLPFAVAGVGPRAMAVAARFGEAWVTTGDRRTPPPVPAAVGAAIVGRQVARLEEACRAAGRDPSSIGRMVLTGVELDAGLSSPDAFAEVVGRYAEVGVTDLVVHWPRATEPFAGDMAVFERIFAT